MPTESATAPDADRISEHALSTHPSPPHVAAAASFTAAPPAVLEMPAPAVLHTLPGRRAARATPTPPAPARAPANRPVAMAPLAALAPPPGSMTAAMALARWPATRSSTLSRVETTPAPPPQNGNAPEAPASPPAPDLDAIADHVLERLRHELRDGRERLGFLLDDLR
jgi:hypothetical protein